MPIVGDAKKVHSSMVEQYGREKGERIFYATANKQGRKAENWKKKSAQEKLADLLDRIPDDGVSGGLAEGMPDSRFPRDQLLEGLETESEEHGQDPATAKDIAKDHLTEDKAYYDHLDKMEQLGSRIMKVSTLVPQRQDSIVPGIKMPVKLVDQQTGQPPAAGGGQPPQAGQPTAQPAAVPSAGAPPPGPPQNPGAPKLAGEADVPAEYTDPVLRDAMVNRAHRALRRVPATKPVTVAKASPPSPPPPMMKTQAELIRDAFEASRLRGILREV